MKRFLRENALSVVFVALFLVFWGAQSVTGLKHYNEEQTQHGKEPVSYGAYLRSGQFLESTGENWESEFLQMAALIWLTRFLRQRGSEMSKPFEEKQEQDEDPREHRTPDAPKPVLRGGLVLKVYESSLTITLLGLFLFSFAIHAVGGWMMENEERSEHGEAAITLLRFLASATFWFQSFQNWQSEFLAVASIIVLSIFLRQKGSPESKPVHAPHQATGSEAEG